MPSRKSTWRLCAIASLILCQWLQSAAALGNHLSTRMIHAGASRSVHKRLRKCPSGQNTPLVKRDGAKYVFMHHIVGNTYGYTADQWKQDIQEISAKGIDAIALNIGSAEWQKNQVQMAYDAASALGGKIKMFHSFDLTEMTPSEAEVVERVNKFAAHASQFKVATRPMISTYSGGTFSDAQWSSIKKQTNGYLMPFVPGLEGSFAAWPSFDSWYCWGCAWPQSDVAKSTADDQFYIDQLGERYATTISGSFYTHYGYKNVYLRGDDWLINNRWEQLVTLRDKLTFVEMVTWNDYGESDYFGPMRGVQPVGTTWATGFEHTAWFEMSEYYITAFKTGNYPPITDDRIYFWARPHPAAATATADSLPPPKGANWAQDFLWAAVFATAPATVTLRCGSSSADFEVIAGVNKIKLPLAAGSISVSMTRTGAIIIDKSAPKFTYSMTPATYNMNVYVDSASASGPQDPSAGGGPTPVGNPQTSDPIAGPISTMAPSQPPVNTDSAQPAPPPTMPSRALDSSSSVNVDTSAQAIPSPSPSSPASLSISSPSSPLPPAPPPI